jgi:hypothetical protein
MDAGKFLEAGGRLRYSHGSAQPRPRRSRKPRPRKQKQCWQCGSGSHLAHDCPGSSAPGGNAAPNSPASAAPATFDGVARGPADSGALSGPDANASSLLLGLLGSPDTRDLILRQLPVRTLCLCRRLCRAAKSLLEASVLRGLPRPTAMAGFSMRVEGFGLGKFLCQCESFDWARMRWVAAGNLPTRRADFAISEIRDGTGRLLVIGGCHDVKKQPIAWADYHSPPTLGPAALARRPAAGQQRSQPEVLPLAGEQWKSVGCSAVTLRDGQPLPPCSQQSQPGQISP